MDARLFVHQSLADLKTSDHSKILRESLNHINKKRRRTKVTSEINFDQTKSECVKEIEKFATSSPIFFQHYIMNLPASAVEFLGKLGYLMNSPFFIPLAFPSFFFWT